MSDNMSKALNTDLLKHRQKQIDGGARARFAVDFLGDSFREAETALRESRDKAATTYKELLDKPLKQIAPRVSGVTLNFSQNYALHRDFRCRYASAPALRRRGAASARQKHYLGHLFHSYANSQ